MIYTMTLNPSLDYIVDVPNFQMGATNRTTSELLLPGGKGINVSIVLNNLRINNKALGFVAGFTGAEIENRLHRMGVSTDFIALPEGESRINVKLKTVEGTEINAKGPKIDDLSITHLLKQLSELKAGDLLVLAGSIPSGMDNHIYEIIMHDLQGKGVDFVVDATGPLLCNVLPYHPFLIKPNNHELGELFEVTLKTRTDVVPYAKRLQEMGARNVLVSLAGEGAVLVTEDGKVYEKGAPKGTFVNGVGAGDSMVAGFLAAYHETKDYEEAFSMGIAAGSASAFSEYLATREEIMKLRKE